MKQNTIKKNILLSLIAALTALLLVFILDIYQSKKKDIEFELKSTIKTVNDVISIEIEDDANMIMAITKTLNENTDLKAAFRARDRDELLALTGTLFEQLRSYHKITHFYFIDPQHVCILRMHMPERYGDVINRYTMVTAARTGKPSYGIELGPLGTLTLRVVQPFYDEKGLIGYLELGEEIDHIIFTINKITGAELYVSIKKKYLDRESWQQGFQMLGRSSDWDMFPDDIIVAQTSKDIPESVSALFPGGKHKHIISHKLNFLMTEERSFSSMLTPFIDARGEEVGDIAIMIDITKWIASAKESILYDSVIFLVISSVLFTILFFYISKVENHIIDLNSELFEEIRKLKQAEEQIRASLKEKEVLMKEVHHRVKNNMAVVSSLLRLQSRKVDDERYRSMFNDSIDRINTMASIHEKLYQSDEVSKIMFSDYIRDTVNNVFKSYGPGPRITLKPDIEKITLGIDASVPCGLIVNELITNSLKYAFPEGREGEITVSLRSNDKGEIEIMISDNGVGMPEGLDFRNPDSLGLTIVNALVRQLQGNIELFREKGTKFLLTFKG